MAQKLSKEAALENFEDIKFMCQPSKVRCEMRQACQRTSRSVTFSLLYLSLLHLCLFLPHSHTQLLLTFKPSLPSSSIHTLLSSHTISLHLPCLLCLSLCLPLLPLSSVCVWVQSGFMYETEGGGVRRGQEGSG